MRIRPSLALPLVALMALPGAAAAQNAAKWEGPYIGGLASYLSYEQSGRSAPNHHNWDATITVFSGFAGYDMQISRDLVFGAELGVNLSASEDEDALDELEHGSVWLRGRLGYAFGNLLVYGLLGQGIYEFGGAFKMEGGDTETDPGESESGTETGGGVEFLLHDRLSARLEYARVDFGVEHGTKELDKLAAGLSFRF